MPTSSTAVEVVSRELSAAVWALVAAITWADTATDRIVCAQSAADAAWRVSAKRPAFAAGSAHSCFLWTSLHWSWLGARVNGFDP